MSPSRNLKSDVGTIDSSSRSTATTVNLNLSDDLHISDNVLLSSNIFFHLSILIPTIVNLPPSKLLAWTAYGYFISWTISLQASFSGCITMSTPNFSGFIILSLDEYCWSLNLAITLFAPSS